MMTRITSESQAAKHIEARLKREKELSTPYRKTLEISEKTRYDFKLQNVDL
jgi:hypothetical protein